MESNYKFDFAAGHGLARHGRATRRRAKRGSARHGGQWPIFLEFVARLGIALQCTAMLGAARLGSAWRSNGASGTKGDKR